MTTIDRLNKLFSDKAFLEANKDKVTLDEIHGAVVAVEPDITKEELDQYLLQVSEAMAGQTELSADELDNVAGGAVVTLSIGLAAGIIAGAYGVGLAIGEGIAHWRNRKK